MSVTRPSQPSGQRLVDAKRAARDAFKSILGVTGFGIGDGVVRIYVQKADVAKALPEEILGIPVEFVVTGDIKAG